MKTALSVIRKRCNYSQAMLAAAIGVSRQMVCAWENGSKKLPDDRAAELAALFGISTDILKEDDLQKVKQWCDRPLFADEKNGRQIFSFELVEHGIGPNVFLSHPGDAMLAARSRELRLKRNSILQNLSDLTKVRANQQSADLNYAEPCVSILEQIQTLIGCAGQADDATRERMLLFVLEQLFLLEYVFTGKEAGQGDPTDWQKQQIQVLRAHWAQINRTCRSQMARVSIQLQECTENRGCLAERLNELYHCAVKQGFSRRDMKEYLERIMREEYDDER